MHQTTSDAFFDELSKIAEEKPPRKKSKKLYMGRDSGYLATEAGKSGINWGLGASIPGSIAGQYLAYKGGGKELGQGLGAIAGGAIAGIGTGMLRHRTHKDYDPELEQKVKKYNKARRKGKLSKVGLGKFAGQGGAIGRLVNADVGANEFPDADVDTPKRGDRAQGAPRVTTKTLINTQEPAPEEQYS